jgi:hypothetical protein
MVPGSVPVFAGLCQQGGEADELDSPAPTKTMRVNDKKMVAERLKRIRYRCAAGITAAIICCGCSHEGPPDSAPVPRPSGGTPAVVTGKAPVTTSGIPAIVILEPRHSARLPEPVGVPVMDQVARSFVPPILFVRTDRPTEFRNSDDELHNINVKDGVTFEQAFNVAVPTGEVYIHTFKRTGAYDVTCDIHAGMSAQIVATSTPYVTLADSNGNFAFPNVVPGTYALTVYAGVQTIERTLEVTGQRTSQVSARPGLPLHPARGAESRAP